MQRFEKQLRIDLAATFRLFAKVGMHESVANHFSAAVSQDGSQFLLNPKWVHFSKICASDLILLDVNNIPEDVYSKVDSTAWAIHGQIHALRPDIRVVLHLHPIYTTTISCLADPRILPIDQNTARYFNRVAIDTHYSGMAESIAEGQRLVQSLGDKSRLMMGNHGILIGAQSIGEAFDDMYTIERACQVLVNAYATGQKIRILSDEMAEKTAQDWEKIDDFSKEHFEQMKSILYKEDPSFAD